MAIIPTRKSTLVTLVVLALAAGAIVGLLRRPGVPRAVIETAAADAEPLGAEAKARIAAFCSACHAPPQPTNFPRDQWHHEVSRCYQLYAESLRDDLDLPLPQEAVRHYRSLAPEATELASVPADQQPGELQQQWFEPDAWQSPARPVLPPAVACLRPAPGGADKPAGILACDMRSGDVLRATLIDNHLQTQRLALLNNPCRIELCDLNQDGRQDAVLAELGTYDPDDHALGRVSWLPDIETAGVTEPSVVADGLGRVSDVQAGDWDNDGDIDLLVAEFGWRRTGGIHLLVQQSARADQPRFTRQVLDRRPGTVQLLPADLDDDGQLDFVALIGQQYERVEAFLRRDETYEARLIWEAGDPAFGSSGLAAADLDGDGDLDLLGTSGETFASRYVKPTHGVHWLENRGGLNYAHHRLLDQPGAFCAAAGDIDLDGDLDIISAAWLPRELTGFDRRQAASLVLLEQVSAGKFEPHLLQAGQPYYASCLLMDVDNDGDLDLVLGSHRRENPEQLPWLTIWRNRAR